MEIQNQSIENISVGENVAPQYAGFWIRIGAYFFDTIIYIIGLTILMIIFGSISIYLERIVMLVLFFFYLVFFVYKYQATLGDKIFGIKTVSEDGGRMSFKNVITHEFLRLVFPLGYLSIVTSRKMAIHDIAAGARVVFCDQNPIQKRKDFWNFFPLILFVLGGSFLLYIMFGDRDLGIGFLFLLLSAVIMDFAIPFVFLAFFGKAKKTSNVITFILVSFSLYVLFALL